MYEFVITYDGRLIRSVGLENGPLECIADRESDKIRDLRLLLSQVDGIGRNPQGQERSVRRSKGNYALASTYTPFSLLILWLIVVEQEPSPCRTTWIS